MKFKQVILVRKDLKLSKGKLAVQVAHASVSAAEKSKFKNLWLNEGQKKAVLKVENLSELERIYEIAKKENLPVVMIEDAGLTELPKGTKTCIAIGPEEEQKIDKITGKLKLL
ncbi:MAG: peptidyl-tRNA hydrolase Pth2 [Candidatus Altiarchaeota archaeon]